MNSVQCLANNQLETDQLKKDSLKTVKVDLRPFYFTKLKLKNDNISKFIIINWLDQDQFSG